MLSKWVGEAEQNIKKLFDAAAGEKRAIIFIDEIEALIPARAGAMMGSSGHAARWCRRSSRGWKDLTSRGDRAVLFMGGDETFHGSLIPAVLRPGAVLMTRCTFRCRICRRGRKLLEIYLSKRPAGRCDQSGCASTAAGGIQAGADIKYICDSQCDDSVSPVCCNRTGMARSPSGSWMDVVTTAPALGDTPI